MCSDLSLSSSQLLCSECGQMLAEAESTMDKFDSVALKLSVLKRQLLALQVGRRRKGGGGGGGC